MNDHRDSLAEWARNQTCGECGHSGLDVEWRLAISSPFALSGSTPKMSVVEWPWLICSSCGSEGQGE